MNSEPGRMFHRPCGQPTRSEQQRVAAVWNCVFCRLLHLDEKNRKAHWDSCGRAVSGNMFGLGTNRNTGLH